MNPAMDTNSIYLLTLCFMSGFTACMLFACSIFLFRHRNTYIFQKIFATVLILHGIGFTNNYLVAALSPLACSDFLNTLLLLFDYVIVGGYIIFTLSLVFYNRIRPYKLLLVEVPFVGAMALFAVTQSPIIYPMVQGLTPIASLALFIWLEYSINQHTRMLKDNVGNIETYDLRWSAAVVAIMFVVQCLWALESLSQKNWFAVGDARPNLAIDTAWCVVCMILACWAMKKIVRQEVLTITPENDNSPILPQNADTNNPIEPDNPLANNSYHQTLNGKNIESIIWEQHLFADKTLTLQKLSTLLGTNRQYLSNYINQEQHKTFYEYINDFRLQAVRELLDNPEKRRQTSIEEMADQAGFNSYATFLRSFRKKYGQTPSNYLKNNNFNTTQQ